MDEDEKLKVNKIENDVSDIAAGYSTAQVVSESVQDAKKRYAKPEMYTGNRMMYDMGSAKKNAKEVAFKNNAKVRDPYTGDTLVLTKKEAKELYGEKWTRHLAESDHITPLEKIYDETKNNKWVSTEDIKNIANSEDNIRVVSRKYNNAKRSKTNEELLKNDEYLKKTGVNVPEKGKKKAIEDSKLSENSIKKQIRETSKKNIVETGNNAGCNGAKSAGISALTISGITNLVDVIKGEKSGEDAIKDIIKDTGKASLGGYVVGNGLTIVSYTLQESSSNLLRKLAESNVPGKIITAITTTSATLKKWGEGKLTTQECLIELGDKSLNMVTMGYSMMIGGVLVPIPIVGEAIGALVGSMLTSSYYKYLINRLNTKQMEHEERLRIIAECQETVRKVKVYRNELETYLNNYLEDIRDCFDFALSAMDFAFDAGDAEGIITSANEIIGKLGGDVKYSTVNEFRKFLTEEELF